MKIKYSMYCFVPTNSPVIEKSHTLETVVIAKKVSPLFPHLPPPPETNINATLALEKAILPTVLFLVRFLNLCTAACLNRTLP